MKSLCNDNNRMYLIMVLLLSLVINRVKMFKKDFLIDELFCGQNENFGLPRGMHVF